MLPDDENQRSRSGGQPPRPAGGLKPWVAPLAVGSVVVIVLGMGLAYVNLTLGAVVALLGLIGVIVVGGEAARSVE